MRSMIILTYGRVSAVATSANSRLLVHALADGRGRLGGELFD